MKVQKGSFEVQKFFRTHSECVQVYDQANKRTWWMPRQLEAMKDVVVCDKLGGAD